MHFMFITSLKLMTRTAFREECIVYIVASILKFETWVEPGLGEIQLGIIMI